MVISQATLVQIPSSTVTPVISTSDGQFVLYSVGWNEKDDDGNAVLRPSDWVDLQQGDWVW